MLALTGLLRAFYGRAFPWLGPHLVIALYYVAFLYPVALLIHALNDRFAPDLVLLLALQYAMLVPYMFVTLRRVYGQPSGRTLARTIAILALAFVIDSPISMAAVLLSVRLA